MDQGMMYSNAANGGQMNGPRFALASVCRSCLLAGTASMLLVAPAAIAKPNVPVKKTTIVVLAGKPSELAFKLSDLSKVPAGQITFKVTNEGVAYHTFKICTAAVTSAAKNTCTGKVTPLLKHGKSATLVVVITKSGKYEYLCTVPGHAAAGMKGLLGIGVTVTPAQAAPPKPTTTPSPTPTPPTSECPPGQTIAANGPGDQDDDDTGAVSDGDGCI